MRLFPKDTDSHRGADCYHIDRSLPKMPSSHERIEEKLVSVQAGFDFFGAQTRSNPGQSRQAMAKEAAPALDGCFEGVAP